MECRGRVQFSTVGCALGKLGRQVITRQGVCLVVPSVDRSPRVQAELWDTYFEILTPVRMIILKKIKGDMAR